MNVRELACRRILINPGSWIFLRGRQRPNRVYFANVLPKIAKKWKNLNHGGALPPHPLESANVSGASFMSHDRGGRKIHKNVRQKVQSHH